MIRGWARTLALSTLVPLVASIGCDLTVRPFAGAVMQFTLGGATISPPGEHLEMWARNQYNDIIRINPYYDFDNRKTSDGLMIRQAISLKDPCLIDDKGNLLTSATAYPTSVNFGGVTQTPQEQAQQIIDRINQVESPAGGMPLLAVLPYDPTPPPVLDPVTTTPSQRLAACNAYKAASELTYVANPQRLTGPAHGTAYGFVRFISTFPPQNYDGFRIDTPVNLKGVQEIFFTTEGPSVDPHQRGPLFLTSQLTPGGRGVVHFDLIHADPDSLASGAVSLYVDLDEDPVQF